MNKILEVKNLSVDIDTNAGALHAVRNVSFDLHRGQTHSLVGESGCGKSITVLALMNLLPKRAKRRCERMMLDGTDLTGISDKKMADIRGRQMSMIFQEPMTSLNPCYTIGNQLMEVLRRHNKVSRREARDRAVYLLEKVGITAADSRLRQYPHQLSGGLRQRAMIAMGLMCGPSIIIADEPTTALDVTIQAQILALLADLQKEFNMSMILITHDLGVVARVADYVSVMYCGQVVESGPAKEIFSTPLHPYTQGLMACIPIPGKTPRGSHLGAIPGMVPTPIGNLIGCIFRNRCQYRMDACEGIDVPLRSASKQTSTYRCLLKPDNCIANLKGGQAA